MAKPKERIVLQARTNSRRLYGKVLLPIKKYPLVILCSKRLENNKRPLIVAIPKGKKDNKLNNILKRNKIKVHRGSLNNVYKRYLDTTKNFNDEDIIIRVTSDNPFVDKYFVDQVMKIFHSYKLDYLDTHQTFKLPYGLALQVFKLRMLRKFKKTKLSNFDKEHVVSILSKAKINKNLKISKLIKFPNSYFKKNLTIDTKQDYLRVKNFFDKTNDPIKTSWNKILN